MCRDGRRSRHRNGIRPGGRRAGGAAGERRAICFGRNTGCAQGSERRRFTLPRPQQVSAHSRSGPGAFLGTEPLSGGAGTLVGAAGMVGVLERGPNLRAVDQHGPGLLGTGPSSRM